MSKISNQLDNIIRSAGWAKNFAGLDIETKFKRITGVIWPTADYINDADNEGKLLWMIAAGRDYPKIGGGPEPERPDATPNTPEQDAIEEDIVNQIKSGTTTINVEGIANNITIPADATKSVTINGEFQDGFTITNLSTKSVTVNNTGEAATVIVDSDNASTLYLKGNYKDVWSGVRTISASSAHINNVYFDSSLEGKGNLSVNADWNDPVTVTSYNTNNLEIRNNSDETVLEGLTIIAPNATVTLYGKWGEVDATVGEDTIYLNSNFHADKLIVKKGNVIVYNCFPEEAYDELEIADGYTVKAYTKNVPEEGTNLTSNPGIYNITEDCTSTNCIVFGAFASGNYKYVNNAHLTSGNKNGACLVRSGVNVYFEGNGTLENPKGYCLWKASPTGDFKIFGGKFIGDTHAAYAEKGFIEIYGGEFEVSSEDKKYLLNVLDSAYTAGTAGIKVFGGKFIDFDPANSMSEPGAPVSFVQPGYKSVQTDEHVWEVFPEEQEVQAWQG